MPSLPEPAAARYRETSSIARRVAEAVQAIWRGLDPARIESGLEGAAGATILDAVVAGQLAVAAGAQRYVNATAASRQIARGGVAAVAGLLRPAAFTGIASDGRPLASLLFLPGLTVALRRAAGASDEDAMAAGLFQMGRIVATQIADADRGSVQVAMAANPRTRIYARVVHLPACGRCIVLAGKQYSYSEGFRRHPNCDCTIEPVTLEQWHAMPGPMDLFNSMDEKQQNKAFTIDGAKAIRMGADLGQVVNARRGMETPTDRTTTEGMSVRSWYAHRLRAAGGGVERGTGRYSRVTTERLTPQAIFDSTDDRDEQLALLRRYAYLT